MQDYKQKTDIGGGGGKAEGGKAEGGGSQGGGGKAEEDGRREREGLSHANIH